MYLKKKLVFVLAIVTYLILVSCETSINYQTKSNVTNNKSKIDNQRKSIVILHQLHLRKLSV